MANIINAVMECQTVTITASADLAEMRLVIVGVPGAGTMHFNDKGTLSMTLSEPSMRGLFKAGMRYHVTVATGEADDKADRTDPTMPEPNGDKGPKVQKRPIPGSDHAHLVDRIIDMERDALRVDIINDTMFLEPEFADGGANGAIIALGRAGVERLRALCDIFLKGPKAQDRSITLAVELDTSEAEARLERLRASIASLVAEAEKLKVPVLGGTTTVTNVAAQDPEACWSTIRKILLETEGGRLTVVQADIALRASIPSLGHEKSRALLEPYAKEQVQRSPDKPSVDATLQDIGKVLRGEASAVPATRMDVLTDKPSAEPWAGEGWPFPPGMPSHEWASYPSQVERRMSWVNRYKRNNGALPDPTDAELRAYVGRVMAGQPGALPEEWSTKGYPMPPDFKYPADWQKMEPKDQRGHWWFLMSGGSMSDMSTEEDLRQFILNGGKHKA